MTNKGTDDYGGVSKIYSLRSMKEEEKGERVCFTPCFLLIAIYTKHPIGFTVTCNGTESMTSGIQTDRFAG